MWVGGGVGGRGEVGCRWGIWEYGWHGVQMGDLEVWVGREVTGGRGGGEGTCQGQGQG